MILLICNTINLSCDLFQIDAVFLNLNQFDICCPCISIAFYSLLFQQLKNFELSFVIILDTLLLYTFHIFLYCYLGKMASQSYEKMTYCLYESNWMELNTDLQRFFVLMIKNTQRPLFYHGYAMVNLHLETFSKVSKLDSAYSNDLRKSIFQLLRTVFSYYMMFKTIAAE